MIVYTINIEQSYYASKSSVSRTDGSLYTESKYDYIYGVNQSHSLL